jgi:hypothetical protein
MLAGARETPGAGLDQRAHGLPLHGVLNDPRGEARRGAQAGDPVVQTWPDLAGEQHEGRTGQLRQEYRAVGGQRMGGRQHGDERFGEHRPEGQLRVGVLGLPQQADVEGPVAQGGDLRGGGHLPDVQVHAGEPLPEVAQQPGQDGQGEGGGEADAQSACPA